MTQQLGDFPVGSTIRFGWNTSGATGASITRATNGTIRVYKNSSTTERSSAAGITDTEDFDAATGMHDVAIDLSDNTDAGFYASGNDYRVAIVGAVIDGQTVNAWLAHFSIENRLPLKAVTRGVVGSASTTTSVVTSSLSPAVTATDQLKGRIITFDNATTTASLRGQATDITASTTGGVLTVSTLSTAPVSGDTFSIT
jgi:hypothetical protein